MPFPRRLASALLALLAGLGPSDHPTSQAAHSPAASGKMVLLTIEPDDLVKYLVSVIQEEMKAPAPERNERVNTKVRAIAVLIAAHAQDGRGARDFWQRAALRDNALRLERALREKRAEAAQEAAARLLRAGHPLGSASPVDLSGLIELYELECLAKVRARGGLGVGRKPGAITPDGLEVQWILLARKGITPVDLRAHAEDLALAADVTAALSQTLKAFTPRKPMGNKNPQDWQAAAEQQRQSAEELARALRAKEVNAVRNAARRVNNACNECHMVFRD